MADSSLTTLFIITKASLHRNQILWIALTPRDLLAVLSLKSFQRLYVLALLQHHSLKKIKKKKDFFLCCRRAPDIPVRFQGKNRISKCNKRRIEQNCGRKVIEQLITQVNQFENMEFADRGGGEFRVSDTSQSKPVILLYGNRS